MRQSTLLGIAHVKIRTLKKPVAVLLASAALLVGCDGNNQLEVVTETGSSNPLATKDQTDAEILALALVQDPDVVQAKSQLFATWLSIAQDVAPVSDESLGYLLGAIDEAALSAAIALTNIDPNHPKVVNALAPPHQWFGINVPGHRLVLDNPDTTYRTIPIDPTASYLITGKVNKENPVDFSMSLWDRSNATLAIFTLGNLVTDAEGNFTVTVDSSAGSGTGNHFQLGSTAASIFVRDTVSHWGVQQFTTLRVDRVGGATPPPPRTADELAQALPVAITGLGRTGFLRFTQLSYAQPINTFPQLSLGGSGGRLATQAATYSAFALGDDEALVVTVSLGGAKYFIMPAYTRWMTTTDYVNHTQTLNNAQADPNPDGTFTFVVSPTDPGVYNWIDTVGLNEGLLNPRWQALPEGAAPSIQGQLVKLADLAGVLPSTMKMVTPEERQAQLKTRAESFAPRYVP